MVHGEKQITVEPMKATDWQAVANIYVEGLATRLATFETELPTWQAWDAGKRPDCRLVAKAGEKVVGWAALSPVSKRPVYAGVAEVSVYVGENARGQGVGNILLEALIKASETVGIWTLTASIFPENIASIHLHQKHHFRLLGKRERIAQLDGVWRDTVLLERRSERVGV